MAGSSITLTTHFETPQGEILLPVSVAAQGPMLILLLFKNISTENMSSEKRSRLGLLKLYVE